MNQPDDTVHEHAWVDVDLAALRRNARRVQDHVDPARLLPMVKADGYGLGSIEVARALRSLAPYAFGVATPAEGARLRQGGIEERIIVFSPLAATDAPSLLRNRLDAAVLSLASLRAFDRASREHDAVMDLHVEIDTGMGRSGLPAQSSVKWAETLAGLLAGGAIRVASVFTHFHSAGADNPATTAQMHRFEAAVSALESVGIDIPLRHAANSDAILCAEQYHLDLVRPGIYLYGGRRGTGTDGGLPDPEPVASVRARVIEVRDLDPASTISYGAQYVTSGNERVATLGVGYADGLPWPASNRGSVIVSGKRVPIRGAVCMDVTSVDVSGVSGVEVGTVATVLGTAAGEEITLGELADVGQTIEWDILTGIGPRLSRRYVGDFEGSRLETI